MSYLFKTIPGPLRQPDERSRKPINPQEKDICRWKEGVGSGQGDMGTEQRGL